MLLFLSVGMGAVQEQHEGNSFPPTPYAHIRHPADECTSVYRYER